MSLKIIFAGTPEFAVPTLQMLLQSEHDVVAVYTQPDRPAGRGQHLHASPVKQLAQQHNIPIFQPKTLRDNETQHVMRALKADIMVVVAYGLLLPEPVLTMMPLGCVNVHPSLLPRWRGAAPIPRAIEAGDVETGITIMQLDKGMDTGPILKQMHYRYQGDESSQMMHDLFSTQGASLLIETLALLEKKQIEPQKQNDALATHAAKIDKSEAEIQWQLPATIIHNKIRAWNAWPVAHTLFLGETLRIWRSMVVNEKTNAIPGTVIRADKNALHIATGEGVLAIADLQLPGKKIITANDFIHGHNRNLIVGKTRLG